MFCMAIYQPVFLAVLQWLIPASENCRKNSVTLMYEHLQVLLHQALWIYIPQIC